MSSCVSREPFRSDSEAGEQRRMLSWPSVQRVRSSAGAGLSKRGVSKFWGGVESKIWPKLERGRGRMGRGLGGAGGGGGVWRWGLGAGVEQGVRNWRLARGLLVGLVWAVPV